MPRRVLTALIVAGLCAAAVAVPSFAADKAIDAQMLHPSIFPGRFLAIEDAATLPAWCPAFGLYFHFADSIVEQRIDDEFDSGVLESVSTADLTAALGTWRRLSLGVDVPWHVRARGKSLADIESLSAEGAAQENVSTLGDVRAGLKLLVLDEQRVGLGLALSGFAVFPTGDPDHLLGEGNFGGGGRLALEKNFGFLNFALNGGYQYRSERQVLGIDVGPGILFGAGISRDFDSGFGFSIEYAGQEFGTGRNRTNDTIRTDPMELFATVRWRFGAWRVLGGGAGGVGGGLGSPSYRALAGIDVSPSCDRMPPPEPPVPMGRLTVIVRDDKGEPVAASLTVFGPQAFAVQADADGTYTVDVHAGAYSVQASREGLEPASGQAEVPDGAEGVVSIVMKRIPPPKPVLTVHVVYEKGKGAVANASLTIIRTEGDGKFTVAAPEGTWSGPVEPGSYRVVAAAAGYSIEEASVTLDTPGEYSVTVVLYKKIILLGTVHFFFSSPRIRDISNPVLQDALQKILAEQAAGDLKAVRIEGHTSSEGWIVYNRKLSERRAEAVKAWLVQHGVKASLLYCVGFGPDKPVAGNDTEPDRQLNRRVEFVFEHFTDEPENPPADQGADQTSN